MSGAPEVDVKAPLNERLTDENLGDELAATRKAEREIYQKQWELENQRRYQLDERVGIPWSPDVMSTLTDLYQITMSYAYWKANKHDQNSAFEVFFRKNPFGGEYTIMAGVNDVIRFVNTFKFDATQIRFLKTLMPQADPEFFVWLGSVDASKLTIYSVKEGNMVFPREPLMRIEGPLAVVQLMETTVLNLLNFASLIATNSARYRVAAGFDKTLLEFGLRRAQGPDGGMSASRFSFLGGFDATSNVRASFLFGIPCRGTHAHAYISSFRGLDDLTTSSLSPAFPHATEHNAEEFVKSVLEIRELIMTSWDGHSSISPSEGELAAFIAYAQAFPASFLALVDTYDTLVSGVPNFCFVAIALKKWGYQPSGIRLDSGDLSYLSLKARSMINDMGAFMGEDLTKTAIVASNSINEEILHAFNLQTHAIDTYGIGTNLVTCYNQPALGMVFKLCEVNSEPTMKISQDITKTSLPYKKEIYRLYDKNDIPLLDLIDVTSAPPPLPGGRVYCQHITDETKRCYVIPSRVEKLLKLHWKQGRATKYGAPSSTLHQRDQLRDEESSTESEGLSILTSSSLSESKYDGRRHFEYLKKCRDLCLLCLKTFRKDHLRAVNPTPYKISISRGYSEAYRSLWDSTAPVRTFE